MFCSYWHAAKGACVTETLMAGTLDRSIDQLFSRRSTFTTTKQSYFDRWMVNTW